MQYWLIIKKIRSIFLSFFQYLIFFIIADLLFSNLFYKEKVGIRYDCFEYKYHMYEEIGYHDYYLAKNCNATETQRTVIPYKVFTDQNGYRYSGKKYSSNKKNLVFLGDSLTYGMGVKYENSFIGELEKKMRNYNIYNLGVPGYGMQKYYFKLNEFLEKKSVEKIIVTLDLTEVADAGRWIFIPNSKSPVLQGREINKEISNWKKIKNSNFKGTRIIAFHLRNFLRYLKIRFKTSRSNLKDTALKSDTANFTYTELTDHPEYRNKLFFLNSLEIINKYFNKISNLAKKNNSELYIMVYPWPETLIHGQNKFNWENFSKELCLKNKCQKSISLFDDFKMIKKNNDNWKDLIYIKDDIHMKKFGNNIIANKIFNEIRD